MKTKYVYLALCVMGAILPYSAFLPWLAENGLNIPLLVNQIATSPIAAFGWLDVVVSALALFAFIYSDGQRSRPVRYGWLAIMGTLTVGVSLGLPLYLFLREISRTE